MADFAAFDVLEVRYVVALQNQVGINVFHWGVDSNVGTGATFQTAINTLEAAMAAAYKACISTSARYQGAGLRRVSPSVPTAEFVSVATAGMGTGGANFLPKQISGILTKRTTLAGRRGRGRVYVPFPYAAANDTDGTPLAAYMTALGTLATAFALPNRVVGVGGNTTSLSPVVYQRGPKLTNVITSITTNDKWASQRRRGDYGRANIPPF